MAEINSGPDILDWKVYAGDGNVEIFEFLLAGDPWNLTGAIIEAQARKTANDTVIAITATVTMVDETLGRYLIGWNGVALRALLAGQDQWVGEWDLQVLVANASLPRTFLRGRFTAVSDVTRTSA